ncbi:MAG: hypothetical protein GWO04_28600 [Actinobacteria bacterium]|nr:hypothetical protein [Actinomycetota bacterium]
MRPLVAFLCLGVLSCGTETATLRVDLRTDLEPRVEFDTIELQVDDETVVMDAAPEGDYLAGIRIAEIDGVRTGSRELLLRLTRTGAEIATRRAIVAVSAPGTLVTIVVSADCVSRVCPGPGDPANATECDFGGCVPPEIEPDPDMGVAPDLGPPDLGPPDLGPPVMCPDDPCLEEDCNGHGWCSGGSCVCDPGYDGPSCDTCLAPWEPLTATREPECAPTNLIEGTDGNDNLSASFGSSHLRGFAGMDDLQGRFFSDRLEGGPDDDLLNGGGGDDELDGGDGVDQLDADIGQDVLFGGSGDDDLRGGDESDRLVGGPGNDQINGENGDDRYLLDGLGDDEIRDTGGVDTARCAPGVVVTSDMMIGPERVLTFESGGSVRFVRDAVETIICCTR